MFVKTRKNWKDLTVATWWTNLKLYHYQVDSVLHWYTFNFLRLDWKGINNAWSRKKL